MSYKILCCIVILIVNAAFCQTEGLAEDETSITIAFKQPQAFQCGKAISWKELESWKSTNDSAICGSEPYYTVKGSIPNEPRAYKISTEIYVPEARKGWPASGGTFKSVDPADGSFIANFCIPQKGPEREFRFQVYSKDKLPIGKPCIIKVNEDW